MGIHHSLIWSHKQPQSNREKVKMTRKVRDIGLNITSDTNQIQRPPVERL